jgi:hypothetical protein
MKPNSLKLCLLLMCCMLGNAIFNGIWRVFPKLLSVSPVDYLNLMSYPLVWAIGAALIFFTFRGKNWARIVYSLITAFLFVGSLYFAFIIGDASFLTIKRNIFTFSYFIILVLLWLPATTRWFASQRDNQSSVV